MSKFQDALLVLVFFYAIFRIAMGEGFTTVNLFLLLGSTVAVLTMIFTRTGAWEKRKEKKLEDYKKKKGIDE